MLAEAPCRIVASFSSISIRTLHIISPTRAATFSIVGAFRIDEDSVASGSSIASRNRAIVVWLTDSEPAVMITITRSPGSSKKYILR